MSILEENWKSIKNRVILPLWNGKFKKMYENAKLDYDDFESLAGFELSKAMVNFDPEKSNLFTFSTRVISQKAATELRDCTRRDKRKSLHTAESIYRNSYDDSSKTILDDIPCESEREETSEISELRVGNFINSLNNNQLRILILTLLDFDSSDMSNMLNISKKTANSIIHSLKDANITRVLYRRSF